MNMRRILALTATGCFVLLLAVVAAFWGLQRYVQHAMEERRAKPPYNPMEELNALGYTPSFEAVQTWYAELAPAPKDNAASLYAAALEGRQTPDVADAQRMPFIGAAPLPECGEPLGPALRAMMADYVNRNGEALALLHEAAAMPACHWPFSPEPPDEPSDTWRNLTAIRLLCMKAVLAAEDGDYARAWEALHSALMGVRVFEDQPFFKDVDAYARAIEDIAGSLRFVLARNAWTEAGKDFEAALATVGQRHDEWSRAVLWGEYAAEASRGAAAPPVRAGRNGGRHEDTDVWAAWGFHQALEALDETPVHRLVRMEALGQRLHMIGLTSFYGRFEWLGRPYINAFNVVEKLARAELLLEAMKCAIAITARQADCGDFPETLDELIPEYMDSAPRDPLTGEPLGYQREPAGFSLHPNGLTKERLIAVIEALREAGVDYIPPPDWGYPRPWRQGLLNDFGEGSAVLALCVGDAALH